MPAEVWSTAFTPEDAHGNPIPPDQLPLMITLAKQRPAYRCFLIRGLDGAVRQVEVAAIPIIGLQMILSGQRPCFGKYRNDACHPLRHPRLHSSARTRDDPVRR